DTHRVVHAHPEFPPSLIPPCLSSIGAQGHYSFPCHLLGLLSSPCLFVSHRRRLQSAFATERGWGKYHQPRNLLLALVGEVGELAELFQWREEAPEGLPGWTVSERDALSDELSDVLIYLVALADKCHVDLPSAARRKIEKNRLKYPAEKVYGSSKKYTEYQK
uniref:dCTP pyrophosphatase 1 n=1 Tax=Varanus komodoensis TaxID=61221 RepID=A0A8D2KU88_VARKO